MNNLKQLLSKNSLFLLVIGMLYLAGTNLATTFINVYLVRVTNNIGIIIIQNIINYATLLLAFMLATKLIIKISLNFILKLGIVATLLYYLCILLLQEKTSLFLIPLGLFNGMGQGFYYFSFNLLVGQLVKEKEQGRFFSWQQSFSYLFGVITPTVSGYIIVRFTQLTGYYLLFLTAVILFGLGMIISSQIANINLDAKMNVLKVLKLKGNVYWDSNKYYHLSNGVREAIFNQIFTVFAYSIIANEQIIGQYNSMMAVIGIFSSVFIASRFNRYNQKKYHLIASIIYFVIMLLLGVFKTPGTLLLVYLGLGIVYCWNQTLFQSMKYQLASRAKADFNQEDYIVSCEFFIALGRITGLTIALLLCNFMPLNNAYSLLIIFDGMLWLVDHYVINKKVNWLEKEL